MINIKTGKIASAYLLVCSNLETGENEAMKIAKMIECEDNSSCGKCIFCIQVDARTHPDVRFIYPDGMNIKREQIIEVCADSYINPYNEKMKIFAIFEAEKMTVEASNSFLKTLEEPASKSTFLLVTTNYYAILQTIRSRCQVLKLENIGLKNTDIDDSERARIVQLIEDASLDDIEKLFLNAKELSKNREAALNSLEFAVSWYREKRNFKMIELIEETKKLLTKNVNVELALNVLLLKRRI